MADLDAMPDDGNRYELLNGTISLIVTPTWQHQLVSREVFLPLDRWVEQIGDGDTLYAPIDVVLANRDVVQPDVAYVDEEHLIHVRGGRVYVAPQLVVEVISLTSRSRDSVEKPMRYAQAGTTEYWLVDPLLETIAVVTLIETLYVERAPNDDGTISSVVLSGLTLDPAAIFARVNDRMRRTTQVDQIG
ncbi:MAG: hypothetical protein AVDCRST_MAG33-91 [uncultured Thermomicrobiales bacterium]|uniref:Putative restriction endonuclease domain-containing protein n=1 Tax=uncultured Thermomicrobiales bacterium TaxID=1645740 RepID=A0A6J4U6E2_9BACT|nr:MAG: hypothetical protein AVDCRST_MAG33-91 [uncultured Thermomicrobiales bacterium]